MPTDPPAAPTPVAPIAPAPTPAAPAPAPAAPGDFYGPPPPLADDLRGLARIPREDEFRRRFPDETACRDFLFRARCFSTGGPK